MALEQFLRRPLNGDSRDHRCVNSVALPPTSVPALLETKEEIERQQAFTT